jgi:hypothetical protein
VVTGFVAALAAASRDYDGARDAWHASIEFHRSTLNMKGPMNRMKSGTQRVSNFARLRVDVEGLVLGESVGHKKQRQ